MKNLIKIIVTIAIFLSTSNVMIAQKSTKELKKEISSKPMKLARKTANQYLKDGWYIVPGAPLLAKQIENSWIKEAETNEKGEKKYIMINGSAVAQTETAAKFSAMGTAKIDLAQTILSQIAVYGKKSITTNQIDIIDAKSIDESILVARYRAGGEFGVTPSVVTMYRIIGRNVEASMLFFYNTEETVEIAKRALLQALEEKTNIAQEELGKMLDMDTFKFKDKVE